MLTAREKTTSGPEDGLSLLEVLVALSVFAILVLSVSITLMRGVVDRRESAEAYQALSALRRVVADIQDTANQPPDLIIQQGVGAIFAKYDGQVLPIDGLPGGQISIVCAANEASVPSVLGGSQDLNLDGDASDDVGTLSGGTDLKIVPLTITATFPQGNATRTITVHRLVAKTTDRRETASAGYDDVIQSVSDPLQALLATQPGGAAETMLTDTITKLSAAIDGVRTDPPNLDNAEQRINEAVSKINILADDPTMNGVVSRSDADAMIGTLVGVVSTWNA